MYAIRILEYSRPKSFMKNYYFLRKIAQTTVDFGLCHLHSVF